MGLGDNCTTGCVTKDHATYGECLRAKRVGAIWVQHTKGLDSSTRDHNQSEVAAYREARKQGIQPATTRRADVAAAVELSDRVGKAFDATTVSFKE